MQQPESSASVFRATYHPPNQEYYNGTGAVPRQSWAGDTPKARPYPEDFPSSQVSVQIDSAKDPSSKDKNSVTKTYHTIKDIISSRFKSSKENSDEKVEEGGLNNVAEELRRSQRNIVGEQEDKKSTEQNIYGKSRIDPNISHQQHQLNQHIIQQQMMQAQQYKIQQQLVQARSQEVLVSRPEEQIYYQNAYGGTQRAGGRFVGSREQNYIQMPHKPQVLYYLIYN